MDAGTGDGTIAAAALPPIWVVSLARATARRRFVETQFAEAGLPIVVLEAVDGRTLDPTGLASPWRTRFEIGRTMSNGEIACAASHLEVYRRMVDEDVPEVLVVEDDVAPTPDLAAVLAARAALPADWDVVTFHSLFPSARPRLLPGPPLAAGYRVCTYERMNYGTQCYLVRRSTAEHLLRVGRPIRLPPDDLLYRRRPAGLQVYGIEPSPVRHADFGSELDAHATDDARGLVRIPAWLVTSAGRAVHRVRRRPRPT